VPQKHGALALSGFASMIRFPAHSCGKRDMHAVGEMQPGSGLRWCERADCTCLREGPPCQDSAPAILLYEPQADGSLELVGVENLVFEAAWMGAGHSGPPMMNGRHWDHMADDPNTPGDEAHGFMPHFDQHVWLFRENPAGEMMPFIPNVTCEHHKG
jgi:hypothetical protein